MNGAATTVQRLLRRLLLAMLLLVMVAPFSVMLLTAVKPAGEIATHPLLPAHWMWGNLLEPWRQWLPVYFRNSLLLGLGATLLNLALALPAAYALARLPVPRPQLWRQALITTQMFSPLVVIVSLYRLFTAAHLTNSLWGLIIVNAAYSLAFAIWLLTAYIRGVPEEMEEAARVDGCSRLGALWRVVLPVARPGIVTTVVFVFIHTWNEFVIAFIFLSSMNNKPLTVGLFDYMSEYAPQWNLLMAGALWAILPVILLFALIESHLTEGLTAGAVK